MLTIIDAFGAQKNVQTEEIDIGGGVIAHYQVVSHGKKSRADDYTTGPVNGTTLDCSAVGASRFSLQVQGVGGTPTAWDVDLQLSNDGTNFHDVFKHTNVAPQSFALGLQFLPGGAAYPVLYARTQCNSVTLAGATSLRVTIVAMPT